MIAVTSRVSNRATSRNAAVDRTHPRVFSGSDRHRRRPAAHLSRQPVGNPGARADDRTDDAASDPRQLEFVDAVCNVDCEHARRARSARRHGRLRQRRIASRNRHRGEHDDADVRVFPFDRASAVARRRNHRVADGSRRERAAVGNHGRRTRPGSEASRFQPGHVPVRTGRSRGADRSTHALRGVLLRQQRARHRQRRPFDVRAVARTQARSRGSTPFNTRHTGRSTSPRWGAISSSAPRTNSSARIRACCGRAKRCSTD